MREYIARPDQIHNLFMPVGVDSRDEDEATLNTIYGFSSVPLIKNDGAFLKRSRGRDPGERLSILRTKFGKRRKPHWVRYFRKNQPFTPAEMS
jgi:hypothetical protein